MSERVLYVDDDELCGRAFARDMRQCGFIVDVAHTGQEALELARRYPYAVLAADWKMPGLDGLSLIDELRGTQTEPVCLLVTGARQSELDAKRTLDLGVLKVVQKPWDGRQLKDTIRTAVDQFHARQNSRVPSPSVPPGVGRLLLLEPDAKRAGPLLKLLARVVPELVTRFAANLQEAQDQLKTNRFEAVVVSVDGHEVEAAELVSRLEERQPGTAIVGIGEQLSDDDCLKLVQAGAQDCLPRGEAPDLLRRVLMHAIERQRSEERLAFIAHHDQLTGLANRSLLLERLRQALARARRNNTRVAVCFLDLDKFKGVNDTLGHDAGDQLLKQVAERLRGSVRDTDTVARLSGDEFAVILEELDRPEEATHPAARILNSFATPFRLEAGEVLTSTSIGIAMFPDNGKTPEALLKCADSAMYRSKQTGRDNYQFFSQQLHDNALRQLQLESAVHAAMEDEEFTLVYQPQVRSIDRRVVGVEALLRWTMPNGEVVAPLEFIPVLEETGLIVAMGEWVLRRTCAQVKAWNGSSDLKLRAAVNISARQFEDPGFVASVRRAMDDYEFDGKDLELEITESILMRDTGRSLRAFSELRELGVRIAIDDFGTGYSSLAYLKRFPIDSLKIDRTFLADLGPNTEAATLASAIIALGRSLGLDVVAEGVETEEQLEFLQQQNCQLLQGYLLARPQSAPEMTRWLARIVAQDCRWAPPESQKTLEG